MNTSPDPTSTKPVKEELPLAVKILMVVTFLFVIALIIMAYNYFIPRSPSPASSRRSATATQKTVDETRNFNVSGTSNCPIVMPGGTLNVSYVDETNAALRHADLVDLGHAQLDRIAHMHSLVETMLTNKLALPTTTNTIIAIGSYISGNVGNGGNASIGGNVIIVK